MYDIFTNFFPSFFYVRSFAHDQTISRTSTSHLLDFDLGDRLGGSRGRSPLAANDRYGCAIGWCRKRRGCRHVSGTRQFILFTFSFVRAARGNGA